MIPAFIGAMFGLAIYCGILITKLESRIDRCIDNRGREA